MSETHIDRRLNAYREDLADSRLQGKVNADRFTNGVIKRVGVHFLDILKSPNNTASVDAQVLFGHDVRVYDNNNGWSWIQTETDGYVGYVNAEGLCEIDAEPTHMVLAPRTFLYSQPDLKMPRSGYRSIGSRLTVVGTQVTRGTDYKVLASGEAVIARHLIQLGEWRDDFVSVTETLLHTPYLWGGNSGFGADCSGMIWLGFLLCGKSVLRDSDMMAETIGQVIDSDPQRLQRGDLIFWKGHVGVMKDANTLLHSNGHTMTAAEEPLIDAIERIGYLYGKPTLMRRP